MDWSNQQDADEEKILVLVRLRPLSEKENLHNEVADWECINTTTVLYRNSLQHRPKAYSFDRVFRGDNTTLQVYNEGVKDVALSVVGGVNSTIFAYGQTSSGKTYTMNGITEYTVADIYEYINKHEEREFVLTFSALEIYNEVVRDLLNADNTALRLLDDPEKGIIVEKLTEETLNDWNHLKKLLSICEAQRQVGETLLNETSSRSHQILRLLEKDNYELKKQLDIAHSRNNDLFNAIQDYKSALEGSSVINGIPGPSPLQNGRENYSSESDSDQSREITDPRLRHGEDSVERKPYESFSPSTCCSEAYTPNHVVKSIDANDNASSYCELEQKIQGFENMDSHVTLSTDADSLSVKKSANTVFSNIRRSRSCRANLMITGSPDSELADQNENTPPTVLEQNFTGRTISAFSRKQWKLPPVIYGADGSIIARNDSQSSGYSSFVDSTIEQGSSMTQWDDDIPTLGSFVAGLEKLAKNGYGNQNEPQVQLKEKMDEEASKDVDFNNWQTRFDKLRSQIIELWQTCNVSLVHRTYFFLLIKKEVKYSIYVEVEHRRLTFLKESLSQGNSSLQDGRMLTHASSKKALQREREMLNRQMYKRYTKEEMIRLYEEWGIAVGSKRRRLQLARRLWSDTGSLYHVAKSAAIVAKLIGFLENGRAVEEMLGLRFSPVLQIGRRSFGWKDGVSSLL